MSVIYLKSVEFVVIMWEIFYCIRNIYYWFCSISMISTLTLDILLTCITMKIKPWIHLIYFNTLR